MRDRFRLVWPIIRFRAIQGAKAYIRLVGICMVGASAIVGSLWTFAHLFDIIAPWPF